MDEITVKDILECVGENINPAKDIMGVPSSGVDMKSSDGENIVVDTMEFNLTKDFFQNLGSMMEEYLMTTTLGDLFRKAKSAGMDANTNNSSMFGGNNNVEAATTVNNDVSSAIRPSFGEINQ